MKIAVLKETAEGEHRVAATPETVKKFSALGAEVAVEAGAGVTASIADADYTGAGASVGTRAATLKGADIVLGVQGPYPSSAGIVIIRRSPLARNAAQWRSRSYAQASDVVRRVSPDDRFAAGRFWRRAASLRRSRCFNIAPSLLLAQHQNRLRHDRCRG